MKHTLRFYGAKGIISSDCAQRNPAEFVPKKSEKKDSGKQFGVLKKIFSKALANKKKLPIFAAGFTNKPNRTKIILSFKDIKQ
ncbi:MAG: hypothetical protein JST78_02010 [Bacteroidetes bacterium]|nr:hypothetical protein [Bacteroidota bacterium]